MKITIKKIQASSLLEVLIAMVILLVIFALSMNVFSNETINTDYLKVNAIIENQNLINTGESDIDEEDNIFTTTIEENEINHNLKEIRLTAKSGERALNVQSVVVEQ